MIQDPNAPLLSELRWFVQQRWLAGSILILGVLASMFWLDWSPRENQLLSVAILILIYNFACWQILRRSPQWLEFLVVQRVMAWALIILDFACLTLLVVFTNGFQSPLLGLSVLHMIFASLTLHQPRYMPYIAWAIVVAMMIAATKTCGQWPNSTGEYLFALGWVFTLLLTIYITTHITNSMVANHDRTRAVLAAAADGVLTVNDAGLVATANRAAKDMFGYKADLLIGKRIDSLITLHELPDICNVDDPNASHPFTIGNTEENYATRQDGTMFPVEVGIRTMLIDGRNSFAIIAHDITQRRSTEAELRKLNNELKKHQDQIIQHEKMIAVGRMAAGVAHEISNPLANMDGLIQLVERNPDRMKADTPELLREQVIRITHIVRQLKDFAHPVETQRQTVSVDVLIQSALDLIRFDRRHQNVVVNKELASPCCTVHIHLISIQQVLVNLIVNALDAESGLHEHQVSIASKCLPEGLCQITVRDNGTGISPDQIDRIFEPFFTTKPMGKGTGLGLSISYTMLQRDGGRIEVESELGVGTTVFVTLPVAKS